jgi:thiol-disulfide isomerase/thioredoxin
MRKRIIPTLLLLLVFLLSITSCDLIDKFPGLGNEDKIPTQGGGLNDGTEEHTHQFTEKNKADIYLKSPATCTEPSIYYYSCSCSERGIDAFVDGEALGHVFSGGDCEEPMICSVCGVKDSRPRGHIWESADEWTIVCTSCGLVINTNDHTHTWTMADCLLPKTCSVCGATEGEALGHNWKEADCTRPKTCLSCGITEGELGNHNYVNKTCTNCGVSEPATYTQYSIKVASKGGLPLSGVTVYVHSGDGYNLCALPEITDENGVVTFLLETSDDYSVELDGAPEGYEVSEGQTRTDRYPMTGSDTLISLTSAPISAGGFKDSYELGDVMYDFTLTDVNGKSYKLSELLGEKDMVMLNFWFANCGPCRREFPYINTVYKEFMDEVEILAINDYDTKADILSYSESFSDKLIIPMFTNGDLSLSNFPSIGYPTTVIIDRYGVICMIEVGAVTGETPWRNLFEHFTADEYEQKLLEGIDSV